MKSNNTDNQFDCPIITVAQSYKKLLFIQNQLKINSYEF